MLFFTTAYDGMEDSEDEKSSGSDVVGLLSWIGYNKIVHSTSLATRFLLCALLYLIAALSPLLFSLGLLCNLHLCNFSWFVSSSKENSNKNSNIEKQTGRLV